MPELPIKSPKLFLKLTAGALLWFTEDCAVQRAVDCSLSGLIGVNFQRGWPKADDTDLTTPGPFLLAIGLAADVFGCMVDCGDAGVRADTAVMLSLLFGRLTEDCCEDSVEEEKLHGLLLALYREPKAMGWFLGK